MQSLSLSKETSAKRLQPALADGGWAPSALESPADPGELGEAIKALTEAEHVIRNQAAQIRRLESMAMTDELTGLLNRRGFMMSLHRELSLARRDQAAEGVLIMLDLDGFKAINDMWGHGVGDDYLQAVAHTLLGCVRSSDIIARLGGDEFVVLFTRMNEQVGLKRLAKLEKDFNSRIVQFGEKSLTLRASFGLSPYKGSHTPEALLANADLKLYAHKASRRARMGVSVGAE